MNKAEKESGKFLTMGTGTRGHTASADGLLRSQSTPHLASGLE